MLDGRSIAFSYESFLSEIRMLPKGILRKRIKYHENLVKERCTPSNPMPENRDKIFLMRQELFERGLYEVIRYGSREGFLENASWSMLYPKDIKLQNESLAKKQSVKPTKNVWKRIKAIFWGCTITMWITCMVIMIGQFACLFYEAVK